MSAIFNCSDSRFWFRFQRETTEKIECFLECFYTFAVSIKPLFTQDIRAVSSDRIYRILPGVISSYYSTSTCKTPY